MMVLNFQDIFIRFSSERKEIELRGIQGKPSKVIISNSMTKLLKNVYHSVIAQLCSLDVQTSTFSLPMDLQMVNTNHSKSFGEMPKDILPT
jgi:hypothetical protein